MVAMAIKGLYFYSLGFKISPIYFQKNSQSFKEKIFSCYAAKISRAGRGGGGGGETPSPNKETVMKLLSITFRRHSATIT